MGHLQFLQKVNDLLLRLKHLFGTEFPQAYPHTKPVSLENGAKMGLWTGFLDDVPLFMELKLAEVYEELKAA